MARSIMRRRLPPCERYKHVSSGSWEFYIITNLSVSDGRKHSFDLRLGIDRSAILFCDVDGFSRVGVVSSQEGVEGIYKPEVDVSKRKNSLQSDMLHVSCGSLLNPGVAPPLARHSVAKPLKNAKPTILHTTHTYKVNTDSAPPGGRFRARLFS